MNKEKTMFDTITAKIVLGQLFKSRNVMHIVHLRTNSYATHKATEKYFERILDLADRLTEVHSGVTGVKEIDSIPPATYIDPVMHLTDIYQYVVSNRYLFTSKEEQNIIDEILGLMSKTKYLLTLE